MALTFNRLDAFSRWRAQKQRGLGIELTNNEI